MTRLATPLPLPPLPPDVTEVLGGTVFDPDVHLALEEPEVVYTLRDFGYSEDDCASTPSEVAITSPFRIMSDEGARVMREVTLALKDAGHVRRFGPKGAGRLDKGVYRSRFMYDFMNSPELLAFMSKLAGTTLVPHPFPPFQAYFNYWAEDPQQNIDNWHVDSLGYDAVMMVNDPGELVGGNFEYFEGPRDELVEHFGLDHWEDLRTRFNGELDSPKIRKVDFPAAGYGVFMQGDFVFHRAAKALAGNRITMVPGFTSLDLRYPDRTNSRMWGGRMGDAVSVIERARVFGWLGREKLAAFLDEVTWDDGKDLDALADWLADSISDVNRAIMGLRSGAEHNRQEAANAPVPVAGD